MVDENLKARLNDWCNKVSTTYSKVSCSVNGNTVVIKRYDGSGVPATLHSFNANSDLEKFLNESDKLSTELQEVHEKFERENGLEGV